MRNRKIKARRKRREPIREGKGLSRFEKAVNRKAKDRRGEDKNGEGME